MIMPTVLHPLFGNPLPTGWELVTVNDIKSPERSSCVAGPFGSSISSKYFVDAGVPVIRGSNLRDDLTRFVPDGFVFVSEKQAEQYKAQHVRDGDLVFTCWGTVGQVGLIPSDGPYDRYIISNKQLKLRPDIGISNSIYLYYYFSSPKMVTHIRNRAIGAAVPGINLGILKALPVVLPPLSVQDRIASVLGAYDDLIEVNRRRIALLEEMARRLFEEWFVHFRFPGHKGVPLASADEATLPQGWRSVPFGSIAADVRDGIDPSEVDAATPYVGLEHIPRRSTTLSDWGRSDEVTSLKLQFRRGDVLFGKIRPYFHKVAWAPAAGVSSSDAIIFRSRSAEHAGLVLAVASSDQFVAHSVQTSNGTKMPRANSGVLAQYHVPLAPDPLLRRFNGAVLAWTELAATLNATNRRLAASRDLLLPRLISGELSVATAEPKLEAAA
jgi:type I restriction enzyme S subunit